MKLKKTLIAAALVAAAMFSLTFSSAAQDWVGLWDFANPADPFAPTAGADAGPLGYADGAGGATAGQTTFDSTTALGLPDINGQPGQVMGFPASLEPMGYSMPTPPNANGPTGFEGLVNDWTVIFDVLYPAASAASWRAFVETDEGITADADLFVNTAGGIGIDGQYDGQILGDTWYRIGFVIDGSVGVIRKYINGVEVGSQSSGTLDGRWAITPGSTVPILTDNDGDNAPGYLSSLQIRDVALSAGQMKALGGPSADGIPLVIPAVPSFVENYLPPANSANVSPKPTIGADINPGETTLTPGSIELRLDGTVVPADATPVGNVTEVRYDVTTLLARLSRHTNTLTYADSVAGTQTVEWAFTVGDYTDLTLPAPIPGTFENFDGVAEGSLPAGWTVSNRTDSVVAGLDLTNPNSDSYLDWVVISSNTLATVHDVNRLAMVPAVVNGQLLASLVSNNLAYAESDVRDGSQVQVLMSPDLPIGGRSSIYLSFHSIYTQNQDNLGAVEYSTDGGTTWLPALYMIDQEDIVRDGSGNVDAVATLNTVRADQAHGLAYGAWILAPITQALAPFISGRVNDDQFESKRVELIRLAQADGKANVRLRFVQAGTASWYFGIDDVGLYQIVVVTPPSITAQPQSLTITEGLSATFRVSATGTPPLTYQWKKNGDDITGATAATLTLANVSAADAATYTAVVSNSAGSAPSNPATLTVKPAPPVEVTGQWDFNQGDLRATVGQDLEYFNPTAQTDTAFDTTTGFGISDIAGQPANVMRLTPSVPAWGGYIMRHGAAPNGDGTYVNLYTVIYDIFYPTASDAAFRALLQTSTGNANDADFFLNGDNGIGISGNYQGTVTADQWHRIVLAVNLGVPRVSKYIDGVNVGNQNLGEGRDGRWSLDTFALLFADEDGEHKPAYINSCQFRNGAMTDAEVAALGTPTAAGIPLPLRILSIARSGTDVVITWGGAPGPYNLQKKTKLDDPQWGTVTTTSATTATVPASGATGFYRVEATGP